MVYFIKLGLVSKASLRRGISWSLSHTHPLPWGLSEGEARSPGMLTAGEARRRASCLNVFVHSGDLIWSSSLYRKEQNGNSFNIPALGVPTRHAVTRVIAFILDSEATVVLFLKMHLTVLRKWELFLWTSQRRVLNSLAVAFKKKKLKCSNVSNGLLLEAI